MLAILSDIHGNLEALTAVLHDAAGQGVDRVYNLGDTIGYGPNPLECLELAMQMDLVLMGNHEEFLILGEESYPPFLTRSIERDRRQFARHPEGDRLAVYLNDLASIFIEDDVTYVHGSPRNHLHGYIFPEDIYNPRKMQRIADAFARLCFCGHTHVAGAFRERGPGDWTYLTPDEFPDGLDLSSGKWICNVGSVGQPRDLDPRAAYALFDGNRFQIRRVEYDVAETIRKIHDDPDIDDIQGDRLPEGR